MPKGKNSEWREKMKIKERFNSDYSQVSEEVDWISCGQKEKYFVTEGKVWMQMMITVRFSGWKLRAFFSSLLLIVLWNSFWK